MDESKKQRSGTEKPESLFDTLRRYVELFRQLPEKCKYSPAVHCFGSAGSYIERLLKIKALPEIENQLLLEFNVRRAQSVDNAYKWLWINTVQILRKHYYFSPCDSEPCIETFAEDCQLVVQVLERKAKALVEAIGGKAGTHAIPETEQRPPPAKEEKGNVNVNIFGDVQARNLQIAHDASIREQPVAEEKKGIIGKLLEIIGFIISFIRKIFWPK